MAAKAASRVLPLTSIRNLFRKPDGRHVGRGRIALAADHVVVTAARFYLNAICSLPTGGTGTKSIHLALLRRVWRTSPSASMGLLAGMFGYLAGIGALFGALALSFFLSASTPKEPLSPQSPAATAMRVAPSAAGKTAEARAKRTASRSGKLAKH